MVAIHCNCTWFIQLIKIILAAHHILSFSCKELFYMMKSLGLHWYRCREDISSDPSNRFTTKGCTVQDDGVSSVGCCGSHHLVVLLTKGVWWHWYDLQVGCMTSHWMWLCWSPYLPKGWSWSGMGICVPLTWGHHGSLQATPCALVPDYLDF